MSTSDWILFFQLIVLIATGVIIYWYTKETSFIRRDTTRQAAMNPSAKLWDRQNNLDQLLISDPKVVQAFRSMANSKTPYFTAPVEEVPRDELYFQLKGYVYLHLNFFEEIYVTTTMSDDVAKQFEREDWDVFIFQYMRHSLLCEVFHAEKNRAYTGEFVRFLSEHEVEWIGEADSDLFKILCFED